MCILAILLVASASASDLNETTIEDLGSLSDEDDIPLEDIEDYSVDSSGGKLGQDENCEILSANHTPKDASEIQTCVDGANVSDTIVLDGYYSISSTISVGKKLNFVGINNATIDGNSKVRLFDVSNGDVVFKNITFINGKVIGEGGAIHGECTVINCCFENNCAIYRDSSWDPPRGQGGALYDCNAINCTFFGNTAKYGGAMYSGSALNCSFVNNSANYGGAMYSGSALNCSFVNNSADGGGAMSGASAVNCTFTNNTATNGGAMSGDSAVKCIFISNFADNNGGAIYKYEDNLNILNCTFINNSAGSYGGAVYHQGIHTWMSFTRQYKYGRGPIEGCTFVNNVANNGGALYLTASNSIRNCTFNENHALNSGGAICADIYYSGKLPLVTVSDSIFNNNNASNAGAIYHLGNQYIRYSIFNNNTASENGAIFTKGSIINCSFINSLVNSFLSADNMVVSLGNDIILTANLSSPLGVLSNRLVIFSVNGKDYTVSTDNEGLAILNITDELKDVGQYNISIKFGGDDTFANSYEYFTLMLLNSNEVLGNTFLSIQSAIDFSDDCDTIILDGYYFNDINSPIVVSKQITFIGINNAILDSKGISRIVNINSTNVTFINITFKNGYGKSNGWIEFRGGAIWGQCNVLNCAFINNTGGYGGAMYEGSAVNCTFINNYADLYGGAMYGGSAVNCTFINNSAWRHGDAMYGGSAIDCIFDKYPSNNYYYTSCLNVNDLTIFNDENVFLVANLSNILGPLFSKVITFNIDGIEYNVTTDSQGIAYLNIRNYLTEYGSYNVMVSYAGDDVNLPVSKNITVTIVNYNTNLEVNNLTVNIGEGVLIASLSDMNGQLYGKTVTFTIEGIEHNVTTDNEGLAKININDYLTHEGNYNIDVNFAGDESNSPASTVSHVIITKFNPILDVDDLSIVLGDDGFLTVRLYDSRGVLVNKRIIFKINSNEYYGTTDLNGVAEFNIKNYLTELGNYDVNVSFAGDDFTNQASKITKVRINSLKANLTVMQEGIYYGDSNLTFRLVNSKTHDPISGAVINLVFSNGLTSNVETDSDGIASYSVPFAPGNYNLTANVISIEHSDINIVELNDFIVSRFIGQIVITQDEDCRDLKIRLYNPDTGYLFKNFNVTLKFSNGIIRDLITDDDGVASYWMNFDEGAYSVNASVNMEFSEFANVTLVDMIINNKPNTEVIFSNTNLRFNYLQTGIIFAGVKGGSISGSDISIVGVPDADISIDENNMISISGLDAGNYMLSVKTTPDASHNSVTCSLNVRVNKIESVLNLDVMSFDYGTSGSSNLDFSGCSVSEDNIYVIGHPEAIIKLEGNKVVVSNLSAGEYTLRVTGTPDSNHNPVTRDVGITVNRVDSDIIFDDAISFDYGGYGTININPVGCTFKYDNISVVDHPEAVIRVASNMVRINNLSAGDYVLRVTTTPDANHRSVTRNIDFTVNRLASILSFRKAISFMFGAYGVTYITTDDCEVIEDDICIMGHPEAEIYFEDNFITVSKLKAGDYILSVTTTPNDDNHRSVTGTLAVNVTKADSNVVFSSDELNLDYLKSGSVVMTLFGCTVDYENITVVNHTEANITLDGNVVTVSNLNPGSYLLCINTTPDENHNPVTCYLNITVNRIASSINFTASEIAFDEGGFGTVGVNVHGCSVSADGIVVEDHLEAVINVTGNVISVSNLTAGNYILRVTTSPDENHSAVIRSIYVVVSRIPAKANFTEDIVVFDYGSVGTVGVRVDGGYVLPKDIRVLNYPKAEVYMDNNNDIRISGLDAGDYVLSVVTTPDESHRAFENFINITVNRVSSKISFGDGISFEYGKVGTADVSVDGGSVSGASVVGHPEADVRIGNNQISVSNLAVGEYTLNVTSTSDSNHFSTSAELDITVFKANSSVTFSGEIVFDYMGSASTFVIVNGGSLDAENISVVGHDAKIAFDNNVISVSGLNAGVYNLTVVTTPDSNHNSVEVNVSVTVNKVRSSVSVAPFSIDYLKSGSTLVVADGCVVTRSGVSVVGHPDDANIAVEGNIITVSGLNPGVYTLHVVTSPDSNHYSVEYDVNFTVDQVSVMISAPKASVYYNSGKSWSVKLYDGKTKEVLSNMKVSVKVYTGSKLYKSFTLTTNAKGIASVVVSAWTVGAHKVVVSFSKDGYKSNSVTTSVTILKTPVVITAPKLSVYLKTAKKWSIKVVDSKTKKALASTKLTLKVYTGKKFKNYAVKTNSKGVATFATSGLSVGTHKVLVSFSKTGYVSKSVSSSIVVKPIPLAIKGDFSYGSSGSTVRVTVTNKLTGKPANGISVKLMVYTGSKITKSYTLVTANYKTYKGFVGFGTNAFSVGTHKVIIKPVSNMYSGQGTTSLVIKSGAANGGVYYSFVSKGKLTLA